MLFQRPQGCDAELAYILKFDNFGFFGFFFGFTGLNGFHQMKKIKVFFIFNNLSTALLPFPCDTFSVIQDKK